MSKKLDEMVSHYGELDNQIKTLSKELDSDKVTLKNTLAKEGLDSYSAGGYKVTKVTSTRTKVDEDKMIKILKEDWENKYGKNSECPYIKTKEYIDMDGLEAVIYSGELSSEVMAKLGTCKEDTEVVALKCTKEKGGK